MAETDEIELSCKELGIKIVMTFDTVLYDHQEAEDIAEMLGSCIEAWHRRRSVVLANPSGFGFAVH